MIRTLNELTNELERLKAKYRNGVITVKLENREYIIENISHVSECGDEYSSHMCLNIRHSEGCNILR